MRADPSDTLPPIQWDALAEEIQKAGVLAVAVLEEPSEHLSDLLSAADRETAAHAHCELSAAIDSALSFVQLLQGAGERILASYEVARTAEEGA